MKYSKQGFVLVCVLWVVTIATVLALGFGHRAFLDRRAAAYRLEQERALMLARASVRHGIVQLRQQHYLGMAEMRRQGAPVTHYGQPWARGMDLMGETSLASQVPAETATVQCVIEDMQRKINVNGASRAFIGEVEFMAPDIMRRFWHQVVRTQGLEGKVAPFITTESIRNIEGITDGLWFGKSGKAGLEDMLVALPDPWVKKVNLNTAERAVLLAIPRLSEGDVDDIEAYLAGPDDERKTADDRFFKHYRHFQEVTHIQGAAYESVMKHCMFTSRYFKITGSVTLSNGRVRAQCAALVHTLGGKTKLIDWREDVFGS